MAAIGGLVSDTRKQLFVQEAMRQLNAPIAVAGLPVIVSKSVICSGLGRRLCDDTARCEAHIKPAGAVRQSAGQLDIRAACSRFGERGREYPERGRQQAEVLEQELPRHRR